MTSEPRTGLSEAWAEALICGRQQTQSRLADGDCLAASLATITGLDVPNLIDSGPTWFADFQTWLRERGWAFTDDDGSRPMLGFSVAVGPSPILDCNHATALRESRR